MAEQPAILRYGKRAWEETDWTKLNPKNWNWKKLYWPFRVLAHPVQAFNEIKYENAGSVPISIGILLLWFFSSVFQFLEYGFQFTTAKPELLNLYTQFMKTSMIIILWTIANWAICTLMDGEGWFKQIWISCCYSVMPQIVTIIPMTIISKVLTIDEGKFLTLFSTVSFLWMVLLMFLANTIIHQYSFKKSLWSMLLTVLGVFILLLIMVLVVSLVVQMEDFISTVSREIWLRV